MYDCRTETNDNKSGECEREGCALSSLSGRARSIGKTTERTSRGENADKDDDKERVRRGGM
jgi:hypothetical protein